ncbi:lyase family protein [Dactylosporangium sp. NPDC048998]|uniref:lyase family protein n=1 Tax=Dactylosporangium sp. NPDC048998 TaxID=3363976 RepID=UPI003718F0E2
MASLLEPGSHRAADVVDDGALVSAMLRVEVAWLHALAACGAATAEQVTAVEKAAASLEPRIAPRDVEDAGNPALPLVRALRAAVTDPDAAALVHRGLTSQDLVDTALMLMVRAALDRLTVDLDAACDSLASLADTHRDSVMAGRTLTQHAVPVTFGLKTAHWLVGVLDARAGLLEARTALPVQCGGAAGTLALAAGLVDDPVRAASAFADQLGLVWPGLPWHSRRTPVTRLGDLFAETTGALARIASDVLLLGRPEFAEVREAAHAGRGGSSTMPQKQNPMLSVLVRSAGLQAPQLAAQLHLCAANGVDERPPGEWQAEWPALRRLLELALTSAAQAAELVENLQIDAYAMRHRAETEASTLLAEASVEGRDPMSYLGAANTFIDAAIQRWRVIRG